MCKIYKDKKGILYVILLTMHNKTGMTFTWFSGKDFPEKMRGEKKTERLCRFLNYGLLEN